MHLNAEQVQRFQAVYDSLANYADARLHVTQPLPPRDACWLYAERLQLIARELSRNPGVFASFAKANPDGLPEAYLDTARAWADGLTCRCALVGFDERGNVLVESDAGTFVVGGLALEPSDIVCELPAAMRITMLPFDDVIVFGTPLDAPGGSRDGEIANMRERAAAHGFSGLVTTADGLRERAKAFAQVRDDDVSARLDETGDAGGAIGAGFRRSSLVGMDGERRAALAAKHVESCVRDALSSAHALLGGAGGRDGSVDVPGDADGAAVSSDGDDARAREILAIVEAGALLRGVVSLSDAYRQYVALSLSPVLRCRFDQVVDGRARRADCRYGLWTHEGVRYVVAPMLSHAGAAGRVTHRLERCGRGAADERLGAIGGASVPDGDGAELGALVEDELVYLCELRTHILLCQTEGETRPVERRMVEEGMVARLVRLDAVVALRDFLDAHVPEGEDDQLFADKLTCSLTLMLMTGAASVDGAYAYLADLGMWRCEGTDWSHALGRLVVNLCNALPRWERGGWSLRQIKERLTGRHETFGAGGSITVAPPGVPTDCGDGGNSRLS